MPLPTSARLVTAAKAVFVYLPVAHASFSRRCHRCFCPPCVGCVNTVKNDNVATALYRYEASPTPRTGCVIGVGICCLRVIPECTDTGNSKSHSFVSVHSVTSRMCACSLKKHTHTPDRLLPSLFNAHNSDKKKIKPKVLNVNKERISEDLSSGRGRAPRRF